MKKLIASLLFVPTMASAEFMSGNDLLTNMRGDVTSRALAIGYVMGVIDVFTNSTICSPPGITAGQVKDIIRKHLEENPGSRHFTADSLIRNRLERIWPCLNGRGT